LAFVRDTTWATSVKAGVVIMSIRNRVMLVTLGFAVVGFAVTLGAQDDKVIIVRDGSVDVNALNSRLHDRDGEKKHKWSKKAEWVQVFEDASAADVCSTSKVGPVKFGKVELKIKDLTDPSAPKDVVIVAATDRRGFDKLKFAMTDDWHFVFRAIDFRLFYGAPPKHETRIVTLEQVVITPEGAGPQTPTAHPATPSAGAFLCVKFWEKLPNNQP
jgi:hypothetical protein